MPSIFLIIRFKITLSNLNEPNNMYAAFFDRAVSECVWTTLPFKRQCTWLYPEMVCLPALLSVVQDTFRDAKCMIRISFLFF